MNKYNVIKIISFLQLILYFIAVFYNPSGPQWFDKSNDPVDMTMSNPVNQVYYSFVFILAFISIVPNYKKFLRWINQEKFIFFFLIWCGITVVFAIDPFVSFKRYFQYITTSLVFISFYLNFESEITLIKILKYMFSIYVILTILVSLSIPDALDPSFKTWRGFHATKNYLGQYAGISIIFFSYLFLKTSDLHGKIHALFFLLLSYIILFEAFSMTNIVIIFTFTVAFFILNGRKIFEPLGISLKFVSLLLFLFALSIFILILLYPSLFQVFFEITGKDPTLTGRTEIWYLVLSQNINDLITGVGFQSFWIQQKLSKIILFQYWLPNQSHNGYVDIILETGIIGLLLFIFVVYSTFKKSIMAEENFWVIIIIYVLILNFSESTLIRPHHFTNVMFFCAFWTVSYKINSKNCKL